MRLIGLSDGAKISAPKVPHAGASHWRRHLAPCRQCCSCIEYAPLPTASHPISVQSYPVLDSRLTLVVALVRLVSGLPPTITTVALCLSVFVNEPARPIPTVPNSPTNPPDTLTYLAERVSDKHKTTCTSSLVTRSKGSPRLDSLRCCSDRLRPLAPLCLLSLALSTRSPLAASD